MAVSNVKHFDATTEEMEKTTASSDGKVAQYNGAYKVSKGMLEKFGEDKSLTSDFMPLLV